MSLFSDHLPSRSSGVANRLSIACSVAGAGDDVSFGNEFVLGVAGAGSKEFHSLTVGSTGVFGSSLPEVSSDCSNAFVCSSCS